ncbi:CsiV family protein [Paraglaciecola sp.]|uniref:CsiV family protein n=1 Tax=Paraglaciecola sp. TaxID=1920173 RepID=UPI003EF7831C
MSTSVLGNSVLSQEQEWWFDVEVILFDRNLTPDSVSEKFKQSSLSAANSQATDLFTPYLTPNLEYIRVGLPFCRLSRVQQEEEKYQQDFAFPEPTDESSENTDDDNDNSDDLETPTDALAIEGEEAQTNSTKDSFEYQVVSNDIFEDKVKTPPTAAVQDNLRQETSPIEVQSTKTEVELSPLSEQTTTELVITKEPERILQDLIEPEWLEWQAPKAYPCVYAEQVEPSLLTFELNQESLEMDPLFTIENTPVQIQGVEWQEKRGAFLLPNDLFRMNDLYQSIKDQKDITPILHSSWRQKVTFGEQNAEVFRLFAGKNFATEFNSLGLKHPDKITDIPLALTNENENYIPAEERLNAFRTELQANASLQQTNATSNSEPNTAPIQSIFNKINQALISNEPVSNDFHVNQTQSNDTEVVAEETSQIWQIDGNIKVYLKNVGRVPYLHIDSNLDYRTPVYDSDIEEFTPENLLATDKLAAQLGNIDEVSPSSNEINTANFLQSANFNQLRRVISKQVHYFDHPLFGMIVRIHRYKWPKVEEVSQTPE